MAAQVSQNERKSRLVPRKLLLNGNGFTMTAGNDYFFNKKHDYKHGDVLVCDRDRVPKKGDVVVMMREGKKPFARRCDVPPAGGTPGHWIFGNTHAGETHFFRSDDYDEVGVVTGTLDPNDPVFEMIH